MSDEFKVQWSVSLPPAEQYAKGDMLNIRGETAEEVEELFDAILDGKFIEKATDVGNVLRAAAKLKGSVREESDKGNPKKDEPAKTEGGRFCEHGKREYRSGERNGKKWAGYFCPQKKKSEQCDVDWVND